MHSIARRSAAEAVGCFALVFVGTGAIVLDRATSGGVTHLGVSLAFGAVVTAMIWAFGGVSGAHINPAVTLGFLAARRMAPRDALGYVAGQCGGALLASLGLGLMAPSDPDLGATLPAGSPAQAFAVEVALTCVLMFVILRMATGPRDHGRLTGLAIGAVVALAAYVAGPISGASMNPARSLGPALASGEWQDLWVYCLAPVLGALGGLIACRRLPAARCGPCCLPATELE